MESVSVTLDTPLLWSDGDPFEGYLVFLVVVPQEQQLSGKNNKLLTKNPVLARSNPPVSAPLWHLLPIKNGALASNCRVWKTNAYSPKGCKYYLYLFDKTGAKIDNVYTLPTEPLAILQDYRVEIGPIIDNSVEGTLVGPENNAPASVMLNLPLDMTNTFFVVRTLDASNLSIEYSIRPINSLLVVDLTQDATGDRVPVFGSNFVDAMVDINMTPGARTAQIFYSDGSNWKRIAPA
jgi:hypothetical protein